MVRPKMQKTVEATVFCVWARRGNRLPGHKRSARKRAKLANEDKIKTLKRCASYPRTHATTAFARAVSGWCEYGLVETRMLLFTWVILPILTKVSRRLKKVVAGHRFIDCTPWHLETVDLSAHYPSIQKGPLNPSISALADMSYFGNGAIGDRVLSFTYNW